MTSPENRVVSQLRHDVDDVYQLLADTQRTVARIATRQQRHGAQIEEVQQTLDAHDARFDAHDARFDAHDARFDRIDARLEEFDGIGARLEVFGARLEELAGGQRRILELLQDGRPPP